MPCRWPGSGALAVNLGCAFLLAGYRHHKGSLTKAAFLSARNDALANVAIIAAGLVTAFAWRSAWPDLLVGLGIAAVNADAAREVWQAARQERAMRRREGRPLRGNSTCCRGWSNQIGQRDDVRLPASVRPSA